MTFAAHSTVDTFKYAATTDSGFTFGDKITGFNQSTDKIDFSAIDNNPANYTYVEVSGAVAVNAAIAGDAAGVHTIVLDTTTGNLYVDWTGNQVLSTAPADQDMQITLVGVTHLTPANFVL
jgi:hypothetical protein